MDKRQEPNPPKRAEPEQAAYATVYYKDKQKQSERIRIVTGTSDRARGNAPASHLRNQQDEVEKEKVMTREELIEYGFQNGAKRIKVTEIGEPPEGETDEYMDN